jgi:Porin subfamily
VREISGLLPSGRSRHNAWMRTLVLLLIALSPGIALANDVPKRVQPQSAQSKKPASVVANPCAQYGAGFVQLPGTTTCVRGTGSIQTDMGYSGSRR